MYYILILRLKIDKILIYLLISYICNRFKNQTYSHCVTTLIANSFN